MAYLGSDNFYNVKKVILPHRLFTLFMHAIENWCKAPGGGCGFVSKVKSVKSSVLCWHPVLLRFYLGEYEKTEGYEQSIYCVTEKYQ